MQGLKRALEMDPQAERRVLEPGTRGMAEHGHAGPRQGRQVHLHTA